MDNNAKTPRRSFLGWVGAGAALPLAALLAGYAGQALAKIPKQKLKYQDRPNKGQRCRDCTQFQPGKSADERGTCKLVEGSISPNGWCLEWEAPPKKG